MNKSQRKIVVILCFILAGLLIIGVFSDWGINYFYIDENYNPFSDFKIYAAVILIALALFLRKDEKLEKKERKKTKKKKKKETPLTKEEKLIRKLEIETMEKLGAYDKKY